MSHVPVALGATLPETSRIQQPSEGGQMTISSVVLTGIPGVHECTVCDSTERVPAPENAKTSQELRLAVCSHVAREFETISALLGLGASEVLSITGTQPAWVVAFRLQSLIVTEVEPDHSVRKVEQALKTTDWLTTSEWLLSDSDIEYLPTSESSPNANTEQPGVRHNSSARGNGPA
jgi:hypothetical protein